MKLISNLSFLAKNFKKLYSKPNDMHNENVEEWQCSQMSTYSLDT